MTRSWLTWGLAALTLSLSLCACSGASNKEKPPAASITSVRPTSPTPTPTEPQLHAVVTSIAKYRIHGWGSLGHLTLLDHYLVFSACRDCAEGSNPNEIVAIDLRTGHQSVVARTAFRGGQTDWSEGTGDTIVYTDQSQEQSDSDPNTVWVLYSRHLGDGRPRVLASSDGKSRPDLPTPRAGGGHAIWAVEDPADVSRADIWVANLATGAIERVAHGVHPGDLGVDRDDAVWSTTKGNVISASLTSPVPHAVYLGGQAAWARLTPSGVALWAEPQYNDTVSLWARPLAPGASTRRILEGNNDQTIGGSDFAAFVGDFGASDDIVNLAGGAMTTLTGSAYVPAHVAADGDLVAFGTEASPNGPPVTLHVDRVTYTG